MTTADNLTLYDQVRALAQPGDVVAFWHRKTDPLSAAIELIGEGPSHVACIRQGLHYPDDVQIIECTRPGLLERGRNGVQTNPLSMVLAEYPAGSRAALYQIKPADRKRMDLEAFYAACGRMDGFVTYDIDALFGFLLPDVLVQPFEPARMTEMVCSVAVAVLHELCHLSTGIQAWRETPDDVIRRTYLEKPIPLPV